MLGGQRQALRRIFDVKLNEARRAGRARGPVEDSRIDVHQMVTRHDADRSFDELDPRGIRDRGLMFPPEPGRSFFETEASRQTGNAQAQQGGCKEPPTRQMPERVSARGDERERNTKPEDSEKRGSKVPIESIVIGPTGNPHEEERGAEASPSDEHGKEKAVARPKTTDHKTHDTVNQCASRQVRDGDNADEEDQEDTNERSVRPCLGPRKTPLCRDGERSQIRNAVRARDPQQSGIGPAGPCPTGEAPGCRPRPDARGIRGRRGEIVGSGTFQRITLLQESPPAPDPPG